MYVAIPSARTGGRDISGGMAYRNYHHHQAKPRHGKIVSFLLFLLRIPFAENDRLVDWARARNWKLRATFMYVLGFLTLLALEAYFPSEAWLPLIPKFKHW